MLPIQNVTYTKFYLYKMLPIRNVSYTKCYLYQMLPRQNVTIQKSIPVLVRSLKLSTPVHNQFGITIFLFSPCGIFIIIMDTLVQLHV